MNKAKVCKGCRATAREKRAAVRKAADGKRVAVRGKVRDAVVGAVAEAVASACAGKSCGDCSDGSCTIK